MNFRHFFSSIAIIVILSAPLSGQVNGRGSITAFVDSIITTIPGATPSDLYQTPNSEQSALWSSIIADMLNGDLASAHSDASSINYDVVTFTDTTNSKTYSVVRKRSAGANYWGTVIIDPSPIRSRLFIQAPHPLHDANTGNQAVVVFKNTGARAFILAGTHRCNSTSLSSCDGTTTVCGGSDQFRKSDQAHTDDGPFQIATERFKHGVPNLIVLQLHGFVKDPGYPDLILGNGTQSIPATDWLSTFKNQLSLLDNSLQYKIAHIDTAWTTLTGTTNTQGRLINNSPDPCGIAAENPNGRFLHIEQAYTGLRDNSSNYAKVASAIGNTFPPDKVIASAATGNWENASTWNGSIIPNDTTHVVISSGHTVTVTTAAAAVRSLSFADHTAHAALASGANLSVHGDLSLASETHSAFTSWASGATVTFAGNDDQTIGGWNRDSTNFSTSMMEMIVDKSAGTLATDGSEMNLNIGRRLEIVDGSFILTAGDDIEGRDLAGSAAVPAVTVHSGAAFIVQGDSSYIRSGTADTTVIGPLQNFGAVRLTGTDLFTGYNFADIYNEGGGTVELFPGWRSSRLLRTDTLLLRSGSVLSTSTTTNVLTSAGRTVLNAGGIYRILASSVNFSANFTNNGTVEYASSGAQTVSDRTYIKVVFANSGTKTWTLTSNRTVDTLEMNGAASLTVSSASAYILSASRRLSMSGGNISTGTNTLALGTSSAQRGSLTHTSGGVIGPFKRFFAAVTVNDNLFPVGIGSHLRSAILDVTSVPAAGSVTARFIASDPGSSGLPLDDAGYSVTNVSPEGYWSFVYGDGFSGGTFSMDLAASGFSGIVTVAPLRILSRPNNGSWSMQGIHSAGSGTTGSPVVSRSGLTTLGEFGIGAGAENPLPVELSSFAVSHNAASVILKWTTASEVNNYGFEIERKDVARFKVQDSRMTTSNSSWTRIGFVEGTGNSNTPHEYSYSDRSVSAGTYSFRLKQIDRDGKFSYSQEVETAVAGAPALFAISQNYPNPFNPSTTIEFTLQNTGMTSLKVYDAIGREVATLVNNEMLEAGVYHQKQFNAGNLASGVYFVLLTNGSMSQVRRIMLLK